MASSRLSAQLRTPVAGCFETKPWTKLKRKRSLRARAVVARRFTVTPLAPRSLARTMAGQTGHPGHIIVAMAISA